MVDRLRVGVDNESESEPLSRVADPRDRLDTWNTSRSSKFLEWMNLNPLLQSIANRARHRQPHYQNHRARNLLV